MQAILITATIMALALAGCATRESQEAAAPPAETRDVPASKSAEPATSGSGTYSRLAGKRIKPQPVKPINVKANCRYRDPTGYGGSLNLQVASSRVKSLQARIEVPKHGNCSFALKDFRQTANEPSVTLTSHQGSCVIRLWEQGSKVTVSFNGCQDRCEGDSFDYVWPIQVESRTGKCS